MADSPKPLLQVKHLKKYFPITKGLFNKTVGWVKAVDDISLEINHGECVGLVGESGSGKTTAGRAILRAFKPTSGQVIYQSNGRAVDIAQASDEELKELRREIQMIFQDPYASLNPRMTIFDIIGEPLLVNGMKNRAQRMDRVRELLVQVGLKPTFLTRYPHAFSGGQRQRIGIARALALNPKLIVADEPVSALDVSVQAQVLNLLQKLQKDLGLSYLLVAHDLSVVGHIADKVAVMYVGKLVEMAPVESLFETPRHPYTGALMEAVPVADPLRCAESAPIAGEVADPSAPPPGCHFHPRCPYAEDICRQEEPAFREIAPDHRVRCHLAEKINLESCRLEF